MKLRNFSAEVKSHWAVSFSSFNNLTTLLSVSIVYLVDLIPRPFSDLSISAPIFFVNV